MATSGGGVKATSLVILLLLSSLLSITNFEPVDTLILDDKIELNTSPGQTTKVTISNPGSLGNGPSLNLPSSHAVQTLDLTIESAIDLRSTGFNWDNWNAQGFINTGLVEDSDGALILGFQGIDWDFDKNNNGWTTSSSSYGQYNTALTCGMNGGNGGSWWTRGSSVTVTSPATNLLGFQGLSLQAWLMQGSYQCGEEADQNEDFYLEYRKSNNQWGQIQYLAGSAAGGTGSVTNVNFVLPSDAYHANFQVRARQTSGSGTCCDYWFFDDISVPGTAGANLTTRSFGWSGGVDDVIEKGRYPPMFLDAFVPAGSSIKWTVLDANTGNPVSGLIDRSSKYIDLSVVDWEQHSALRLNLELLSNPQGESPRLYGISGGGRVHDEFHSSPTDNGWVLSQAEWSSEYDRISGDATGTALSPNLDVNLPIGAYRFQSDYSGDVDTFISINGDNFTTITASQNLVQLEESISSIQLLFQGANSAWTVENFKLDMIPTNQPLHPSLDVDGDGRYEWSVNHDDVGTWGMQDTFASSGMIKTVQVGLTPSSMHNVLIPRDALDFEVSANNVGSTGLGIQTLALWIGNQMISQTGGNGYVNGLHLELNHSEMDALNQITGASAPVLDLGGTLFVLGKVELVADAGTHELAGLYVPYDAIQEIKSTAIDELVMAVNRVRLDQSMATSMYLKFSANNSCSLDVTLDAITSSSDVTMGPLSIQNDTEILTPSQKWRDLNTRAQVHASSPHQLILNMYSDDHIAQWFVPLNTGGIVQTGDYSKLIFSEEGINSSISGDIYDLELPFRTAQSFDDQQEMRLESRIQLANGYVSMPAIKYWSNPAIENDIKINTFDIITDTGLVSEDTTYLRAAENLTFIVDVGFEYGAQDEKPYPGEFILELKRNEETIANTTGFEGDQWYVNSTSPFTSGDVTWTVTATPLEGGGFTEQSEIAKTFNIDPLSPVVVGANIRQYDHKISSQYQLLQINITDQPVLPSDVSLMLWMEWANDLDGDGWPSEGEFIERTLQKPSNLDATYGTFHTFIDDTAGFVGEKIAGYIVGNDPSGHLLLEGGSSQPGDHLFMYHLREDGSPLVDSDGFEWSGGRRAWLHPGQVYELNISFTELNGISDISIIEVALADNIGSDRIAIEWNSITKVCESMSTHMEVVSCSIRDHNGQIAGPYVQDLILNMELRPGWTMPDLGDTRREPIVRIEDRSGQADLISFPQNRWRFSAELMISDEVSLWVENGAINEEGARVSPGSRIELGGDVVFARSGDSPQFECEVDVRLDGVKTEAMSYDGAFTASIFAPTRTGQHALTWELGCLPEQGIDLTSSTEAVRWITVDDIGPEIVEFVSPRPGSILDIGVHDIRVIVSESYGIDKDSVELIWWITSTNSNDAIDGGSSDLILEGDIDSGLRLEFVGGIDITTLDPEFLQEQLVLKIRLEGRDQAGNSFELESNNENNPASKWNLIHHVPEFSIDSGGVEVAKTDLEVDESTTVQIHVRNSGLLAGEAELLIEVVDLSGSREQLARTSVWVDSKSVSTGLVDWKPLDPGIQWIEVSFIQSSDDIESSRMIDVKPMQEKGVLSGILGDANPWLIGMVITMLGLSMLMVLVWMRLTTARQGVDIDEWEYEDED
ncbi:MAG: hypothetical protein QGI21_06520 [Candidatus Poseidoniaceae archaeon]|jgi:hypothetical protein|nr:hypothetical protein [Candidatus Poseidoniaceae archaeon]